MKMKFQNLCLAVVLPAALLTLSSCATKPTVEVTNQKLYVAGTPGGVTVDTYRETATVTAVDKTTREVNLVTKEGTKKSFIAGPQVANFPQIEVGDQVIATITEQLVVFVRQPGEPADDGVAGAAVLAPLGAKPAGVVAKTDEITATVKAIDLKNHKATLEFPDGSSKTYKVRPDVDLTKQTVGSKVVFRTTQAVALSIEKP